MRTISNPLFASVLLLSAAMTGFTGSNEVWAQEKKPEAEGEETPGENASQVRVLPPAYDSQMLRLAEILGSLHYLRDICNANEGQIWRNEMQAMIDAEEPVEQRRAQLIAHFNRGFRGYQEIYRKCTPAAAEAANQYLREGVRIATEIPSRYGR